MTEYDKSLVRTRTSLKRFKPKVQNKLVLRGLLDLTEVRDETYWFHKGKELREQENFEEALDAFEKGLKLNPDDINILWSKGYSLFLLERYKDASKCYYRAIELENNPEQLYEISNELAWLELGLEIDSKDLAGKGFFYRIALKSINKALNLGQNDFDYLLLKVIILRDLERYEEALMVCDKIIEIDQEGYMWKGGILHELGRYEEAIKVYDRLIELEPNNPNLWYDKAKTFSKIRHHTKTDIFYDEAINVASKAIEKTPDLPYSWYRRASIFSLKGDKVNALEDLSKAITLGSRFSTNYKEKARENESFKSLWEDNDFKQMTR